MKGTRIALACLLCSLAAHASLLLKRSDRTGARARPPRPAVVQLSVVPAARPEPPREVAPPPEPVPEEKRKPNPAPPARVAASEPVAEPVTEPAPQAVAEPAASDSPPLELTGTTLVSDLSGGWSALNGSGSARRGPIRAGLPHTVTARPSAAGQPSRAALRATGLAPRTTPLRELSQKPAPPPLTEALERNYPPQARTQGKAGEAKVRALISPSGRVSQASVTFETAGGFGQACQKTLLESTWTAPRDRDGKPATTWVTYRCKFRVGD